MGYIIHSFILYIRRSFNINKLQNVLQGIFIESYKNHLKSLVNNENYKYHISNLMFHGSLFRNFKNFILHFYRWICLFQFSVQFYASYNVIASQATFFPSVLTQVIARLAAFIIGLAYISAHHIPITLNFNRHVTMFCQGLRDPVPIISKHLSFPFSITFYKPSAAV